MQAFIFDMDGVVTNTADAHFAAWKEVFDEFFRRLPEAAQESRPFTRKDYLAYVDGIPRYEGVRAFLKSRGIRLPEGDASDVGDDTVKGLGNRKNERFREWLERNRIDVFDDALELIDVLRRNDIRVGIFSSSRNAKQVLESARVTELFDVVIDGADAEESGLPMKPDPAVHDDVPATVLDTFDKLRAVARGIASHPAVLAWYAPKT
ncbi:HAD family hydrolase [Aphanothece microscopica]|uniref:HAD family hydrolase n=1 Tax=Aphanothece microscopica TaxID=1049561 RepID=UPI003984D6A3